MAISKVGLGWPSGERQYTTLAAWLTALKASGAYEEAWCSGDLGAAFVSIGASDFPQGALIRGDVQYTGANHTALAKLPRTLTIASANGLVVAQDLWITHNGTTQPTVNISASNYVRRLYIDHSADPGSNAAILMTSGNAVAEYCVVRGLLSTASKCIRPSSAGIIRNCVGIGTKYALFSEWTNSKTERCYGIGASISSCLWGNGRPPANITNASEDATGDVGFQSLAPTVNFVDYANADYRIRASSPLHAAGIGAFFEDATYIGEGTITASATVTTTLNSIKVGNASAAAIAAALAASQGSKLGSATLSLPITAGIDLSALKNTSASITMPMNAVLGITANKIGVSHLYIEAVADVSLYAGNVYIGQGTFSVTAAADINLQGGKVGSSPVQFNAAATAYCAASKQAQGTLLVDAGTSAQVQANKTAHSTIQNQLTGAINLDGFKMGAGTPAVLASVTISISATPAANQNPVTVVFVRTSSRHHHNMRTSSRYSYNVKTSSGGARV